MHHAVIDGELRILIAIDGVQAQLTIDNGLRLVAALTGIAVPDAIRLLTNGRLSFIGAPGFELMELTDGEEHAHLHSNDKRNLALKIVDEVVTALNSGTLKFVPHPSIGPHPAAGADPFA